MEKRWGRVLMISRERTVTFLWRCSGCPAVYDAESLAALLDDGTSKACFCGGRLVEGFGPAPEREPEDGTGAVVHYRTAVLLRGL